MAAKRRMSRRQFLWASAIGSAGVVAAACQPAAMPAAEMADEGEGDAPAMEAVEIRFSHWHGGFWDPIRDGISEAHPEITAISESTPWGEYSTKLLTQMVGGVAPDVVMVDSYWQGEWFKVLLALDDALDAHGVDNSKWDADPWMQCGNDGKIYSLSQVYCPNWQLVVNRTLAEEAGIDLPDWGDDGPNADYDEWRWDDLVELLKATTKVNSAGEVEQWGLANSTGGFGATALYFMYSNGAQALDDLWGYQETEALVDSEESVQALQAYIDLTLVDKVAPTPAEAKAVQGGLFNSGKAFCTLRHPGVGDQRVNQEAFGAALHADPVARASRPADGHEFVGCVERRREYGRFLYVRDLCDDERDDQRLDHAQHQSHRLRHAGRDRQAAGTAGGLDAALLRGLPQPGRALHQPSVGRGERALAAQMVRAQGAVLQRHHEARV